MNKKTKRLSQSALIAALYMALTYAQYAIAPTLTSGIIQFRISEALCVLAFFTPAAIGGLTVGCLLFNISNAGSLPLDFFVGTLATFLSATGMYHGRKIRILGFPFLGLLLPAVLNGLLVGWELDVYMGGGFLVNAVYVAIGEAAVLLTLGTALYYALKHRDLDRKLFK